MPEWKAADIKSDDGDKYDLLNPYNEANTDKVNKYITAEIGDKYALAKPLMLHVHDCNMR